MKTNYPTPYQTPRNTTKKEGLFPPSASITCPIIPGSLPIKEKARPQKCKVCKKEKAKDYLFCKTCLSRDNRELTFQKRVRVLLDLKLMKRGYEK